MPRKTGFAPELNKELYALGYTQYDLAKELGRSQQYVSMRMTGKCSWEMDEVYQICTILGLDIYRIPVYFPPTKGGDRT